MGYENNQDDATSTTGSTIFTPCSSQTTVKDLWDGHVYAVPWPGHTYMILEKASGRAITLTNGLLRMQDIQDRYNGHNHWLCVEANGYFGFYNAKSGTYIGHDGDWNMRASAAEFRDWEYMTPRRHPDGGYQLLSPFWHDSLRELAVTGDGMSLVRRQHGTTLWEFVKVPGHL